MAATPIGQGARAARAELFVLSGPDVGRSFPVAHGATLGRAPDRDVVFRDRSISRHHAHFECAEGVWSIVDDGSTNGFVVDGHRRERADLGDLREFVIGDVLVRLRTQFVESTAPAAAPAPAPAPPHPGDPGDLGDEIEIDADPEATSPTLAPRAAPRPAPPPPDPAPAPAGSSARAAANAGPAPRGQRVLQFHKQEARHGLLVTDLDQRPWWVRGLVLLVALAFAGVLAWAAYRGVLSVREDLGSSDSAQEPGR